VGFALIGCGGRGHLDARLMQQAPGAELRAVCDVFDERAQKTRQQLTGGKAPAFKDFRKVLELKEVDAILLATPDHWHAIPTVLACQAGKDVYVEKPFSLTIREGRKMVEAAERHKRIVMPGMQHRSAPHIAEAARLIQSGYIGEVYLVRSWNSGNLSPNRIPKLPDADPPAGLDWDFFQGPVAKAPYNPTKYFNYRQFYAYSGGYITDFGNHRIDSVHQIMNVTAPRTIAAAGGKLLKQNDGDVPELLQVTYEYPGFILDYVSCWVNSHGIGGRSPGMAYYGMSGPYNRPHGFAFYGTRGAFFVDRIGYEIFPELDAEMPRVRGGGGAPAGEAKFRCERKQLQGEDATALHTRNFIQCLRERGQPFPDAEAGHRSTSACLLGNIAYQAGRKLRWNAEREDFENDREASRLLSRPARAPWNLI
jgi:predicted dehydrogenase